MRDLQIIITGIFFILFTGLINAQNISIDDSRTPQDLVDNVLINSTCAMITNASGSGQRSYASFKNESSSFPFSEGIILSTSASVNAIGPYVENDKGGGGGSWIGDSDSDTALGTASINATYLEFDFTPLTNYISFNYLFASNEYQLYYPCTYSDGFAFLIKEKGSNDPYKNLAVIPNSTTAVSSLNVHPRINPVQIVGQGTHNGCPAVNEEYFNGLNTSSSPINYAGQTVVLNAQTEVTVGTTYHIKLVIADDKNEYFDSAVFIEAGSFKSVINLGEDKTSATNNAVCYGTPVVLDTGLSPSYTYKWYKNNRIINLATAPTYSVTSAGIYKVEVTLSPSTCTAVDEIVVDYTPKIIANNTTLIQCDTDNDGFAFFNLTKVEPLLKSQDSNINSISYFLNDPDSQNNNNPITNPTNYRNVSSNQIIYGRAETNNGCFTSFEIELKISNNTIQPQAPYLTCDEDTVQDGIQMFNLSSDLSPQITVGLPLGLNVNYYNSENDAISETNVLPNSYRNKQNPETIYAKVINGADCYGITPITLKVNTFDPPNFQDEIVYLCKNASIILSVENTFSNYMWNTGATSNSITVHTSANYNVTVTDSNGCQKTKKFTVKDSGNAIITDVEVKDFSGEKNSALIKFTGVGDFEFSIDGTNFQDDPLFTNVLVDKYEAIAKDKNGCGNSNSYTFYVIDYPHFFTPNGDGFNDTWEIKNLDQLPSYTLVIFDRYGKLLKQLLPNSSGWTGLFNGKELPADDYWFRLSFVNGKEIKGHFSLKR